MLDLIDINLNSLAFENILAKQEIMPKFYSLLIQKKSTHFSKITSELQLTVGNENDVAIFKKSTYMMLR